LEFGAQQQINDADPIDPPTGYQATNEATFPFAWVEPAATQREYATVLTKISREYEQRF